MLWHRVAAVGIQEVSVRVAPYAGGVIRWFVAQLGSIGILLVEFLLTVILAAAMYANGERATQRLLRFWRRLAGSGGENAVFLAGQTVRGVALCVVVTALAQAIFVGPVVLAVADALLRAWIDSQPRGDETSE